MLADAELDAVAAFGPDHDDLDLGPARRLPSLVLGAAVGLVLAGGAALVLAAGGWSVPIAPAAEVHSPSSAPASALSASVTVDGGAPVRATVRLVDTAAVPTTECLGVDWGDGTVVEAPSCVPPACDDPAVTAPGGGWLDVGYEHAYAAGGTYVVAVTARGCDGSEATASATVTVP